MGNKPIAPRKLNPETMNFMIPLGVEATMMPTQQKPVGKPAPGVSEVDTDHYLQDCLTAAGWTMESALPEELAENYTAHILFPQSGDAETVIRNALEKFYEEMKAQSRLVQSTITIPGRRSTVQQEDLKRWILAVVDLEQEYGEVQKEVQEYCRRVYSSTELTLMETLGGSRFVRDNCTHLAKLAALVRQKRVASNLLKAVNSALRALMQDGFQGEVFQKIREEQPDLHFCASVSLWGGRRD